MEGQLAELCSSLPEAIRTLEEASRHVGGDAHVQLLGVGWGLLQRGDWLGAAQAGQAVIDACREQFYLVHWKDVHVVWRQVYSGGCTVLGLSQLGTGSPRQAATTLDLALLMGAPMPSLPIRPLLAHATSCLPNPPTPPRPPTPPPSISGPDLSALPPAMPGGSPVPVLHQPALAVFLTEHLLGERPVLITDAIDDWPALSTRPWSPQYLKQVAGYRLVPVEMGRRYTDQDWTQQLMAVGEFVDSYLLHPCPQATCYLAQHQLLSQIPELLDDVTVPDYCHLLGPTDGVDGDVTVHAWIGPGGTVSPLHHDPQRNIFAQVVGHKYVRIYHRNHTPSLYPHPDPLLANTSQVDVDDPSPTLHPLYALTPYVDCVVGPGQLLYIPKGHWHYVRSLDTSFSLSFWW